MGLRDVAGVVEYFQNASEVVGVDISAGKLAELQGLISAGESDKFYSWTVWEHRREEVLKLDRYECQLCKARGRYKKASIVHHVKHLKDRPDLALSIWDGKERQLLSVCKRCHEEEHPESQRQYRPAQAPLTEERWD